MKSVGSQSQGSAPDQFTAQGEIEPSTRQALIGDALARQGDFAAAYARYRQAARLEPDQPEHRYKLALAALSLEDPLLTERHLLDATRIDPRYVPAHYALARLYRMRGRTEDALRHGSTALSLEPASPLIVTEHALGLLSAG